MPKLTRADVTVVDPQMCATGLPMQRKLIQVDGHYYIISAWDRISYRGEPVPECGAMHATADGEIIQGDVDDLFDATLVYSVSHEACITALVAHLNGEPVPVFEYPTPEPTPEPVPPFDLVEYVRERAANDPKLSDDAFVLLNRAFDGRSILDDATNPTI